MRFASPLTAALLLTLTVSGCSCRGECIAIGPDPSGGSYAVPSQDRAPMSGGHLVAYAPALAGSALQPLAPDVRPVVSQRVPARARPSAGPAWRPAQGTSTRARRDVALCWRARPPVACSPEPCSRPAVARAAPPTRKTRGAAPTTLRTTGWSSRRTARRSTSAPRSRPPAGSMGSWMPAAARAG
jgi:hypothetical protein